MVESQAESTAFNNTKNQLVAFISSEKLLVASEGAVYKAVLRWVGSDPRNRGSELPLLLQHVHFPLMSRDEVCKCQLKL